MARMRGDMCSWCIWKISGNASEYIYHLSCGALGDQIAVPEIVDLDVLNIVAVGNVHFRADGMRFGLCRRSAGRGTALSGWCVGVLNILSSLHGGVDARGGRGLKLVSELFESSRKRAPSRNFSRAATYPPQLRRRRETSWPLPTLQQVDCGPVLRIGARAVIWSAGRIWKLVWALVRSGRSETA